MALPLGGPRGFVPPSERPPKPEQEEEEAAEGEAEAAAMSVDGNGASDAAAHGAAGNGGAGSSHGGMSSAEGGEHDDEDEEEEDQEEEEEEDEGDEEEQQSDAGASQLSALPPRRAAAAAASSSLAASASGALGGPSKASGSGHAHFTITEGRASAASSSSSASASATSKARGGSKSMKRSLHRAGGLLNRSAFTGSGSGAGAPAFLQGSAACVDGGLEAYWQYHLHVQQLLQTGRSAPHRKVPPPPGPPQSDDWARLAFGGFSNALAGGQLLVEEPWVALGPSAGGPPAGKAVLDLAAAQAAGARESEAALARRLEDVQGLLKQKPGGEAAAAAAAAGLQEEALALASLGQQRELWARLLRWQAGRPLPGVTEHGYVALPEAVVVKQRLKRQSRSDIKRFEREQRKRQLDREEGRRRRLRGYLQGVMAHREEFLRFHRQRRGEQRTCAQAVRRWFDSRDKRVEREKDNEERARLQALKDNDMDEYIRLVEKTRNERLNYLIQQTDAYIAKIADLVQSERAKAGGGDEEDAMVTEAGLGGEAADAGMSAKARGYYAITHRRTEEVSQPALLKGGALKEYQLAGLQWMVSLYNNQLSGILADEMGLGKTIQTISLITYVMEAKGNLGPFLIVVPLSTLSNWVNEFKKWAPDVLLVQYKGNPDERKQVFREEMEGGQFNVVLTTYELVMKDKALLGKRFEWEYIIVDEGHRMKNTESKFAQTLGSYYASKRRLLLTGTPLQNNLPELWSLLNFLLPSIFDSADSFDQWFNKPFASFGGGVGAGAGAGGEESEEGGAAQINEEEKMLIIQRLHELLRPFMLRRVKAAVMGQLPTKVEKVLKCELSGYQRRLYRDLASKALRARVPGISMNNVMMHLRKCCNHPYLFQDRYTVDEHLVRASGKLELLDRLLPKLKAAGHRVLLFSQMTQMLDILEDYFTFRGYRHLRLDGQTSADDREERMYQFNAPDSPYFIFALSTRAGGLGLNLATADTVIFYDSDWNPSMDSQAMDRAHRIGQKNDVRVFRLITTTAVEEKIISRANEKAKITNLVVEAGKFNRDSKETERRAMVESLLREAGELEGGGSGSGGGSGGGGGAGGGAGEESTVPDDEQLNDMMATTQEELELYRRLDAERDAREAAAWAEQCAAKGLDPAKHLQPPRLAADVPLDSPDLAPLLAPDAGPGGAGSGAEGGGGNDTDEATILSHGRKRKEVSYTDNLTEKQFVRMMEKRAKEEEEEKEKRRAKARAARGGKGGGLPQPVLDAMLAAYNAVRGLKDEADGRALAELFVEKPNKKLYPDYFEVIQTPIDLKTIRQRIKNASYGSLAQFQADFRLLFANAFTYNEEASLVCQDARRLRAVFEAEYAKVEALAKSLAPPSASGAGAAGGAGGAQGGKSKKAKRDGGGSSGGDGFAALAGLYEGSNMSLDG